MGDMNADATPSMFISHTTRDLRDHTFAIKLSTALRAIGIQTWIAPQDIPVGADWQAEIVKAIMAQCTHFIVILSAASIAAHQVLDEIALAKHRHDDTPSFTVFPLQMGLLPDYPGRDFLERLQKIPYSDDPDVVANTIARAIGRTSHLSDFARRHESDPLEHMSYKGESSEAPRLLGRRYRRALIAGAAVIAVFAALLYILETSRLQVNPPMRSTSTTLATPQPAPTQVIRYQPWLYSGLANGIIVDSSIPGYCIDSSSDVIDVLRSDAFRCISGNDGFNPCFSSPYKLASSIQVACPGLDPAHVTIIRLIKSLPDPATYQSTNVAAHHPWLVQLSTGLRCIPDPGGGELVADLRESFDCSDGTNLLGDINATAGTWTIQYRTKDSPAILPVAIVAAYE